MVFLLVIPVIYAFLLYDTNDLMNEVRDAFHCRINRLETLGKPINMYNMNRENETLGKSHLTLLRMLTLHNYRKGYIWAIYNYRAYDDEGQLIAGSAWVPTKWEIQKTNGSWEIVDIFENP